MYKNIYNSLYFKKSLGLKIQEMTFSVKCYSKHIKLHFKAQPFLPQGSLVYPTKKGTCVGLSCQHIPRRTPGRGSPALTCRC